MFVRSNQKSRAWRGRRRVMRFLKTAALHFSDKGGYDAPLSGVAPRAASSTKETQKP